MKNHFFYPYVGNKREEVEHIYNLLDLNNINTIVEPFCGSCAVSYYIWSQNKDKNYKYILNDLDSNLINLLKSIRNGEYKDIENEVNKMREEILEYQNNMIEAKTIYLKHVKSGKLSGYILGHKYYKLRSFCFPLNELNRFNKKLDLSIAPIYDFLKNANIELYNELFHLDLADRRALRAITSAGIRKSSGTRPQHCSSAARGPLCVCVRDLLASGRMMQAQCRLFASTASKTAKYSEQLQDTIVRPRITCPARDSSETLMCSTASETTNPASRHAENILTGKFAAQC
jgi:hypothetical protein